jgi:hypothetical protein
LIDPSKLMIEEGIDGHMTSCVGIIRSWHLFLFVFA